MKFDWFALAIKSKDRELIPMRITPNPMILIILYRFSRHLFINDPTKTDNPVSANSIPNHSTGI
jgi:hypothetical protein